MSSYYNDCIAQARLAVRAYAARKDKPCLPKRQQEEVKAVAGALNQIAELENGETVVRFLTMYHIERTHTLEGAAMEVGYSARQCMRYNRMFLNLVAQRLGYR